MDYDKIKDTDAKLKVLLLEREKRKGFIEKLKKTATVYDAWKEIVPLLKDIAVARHNKNMKEAETLFKVVYIRIEKTTSIRRALNESEIQEVLEKKDYLGNFSKKMLLAETILDKAQKFIQKGTALCNIGSSLYGLYVGHTYRHIYKEQISKAAELRMQMYHGQEQMMHVIRITKELSKLAPPGIQEYLEYNMAVFEACGETFDLVNKYAKKIEDLSAEVFPKLRNVIGSNKISAKSGQETEKMKGTVNQKLDLLFKMAD